MIPAFDPKSGFKWGVVRFEDKPSGRCSYCDNAVDPERCPRKLFAKGGETARFCQDCSERWFDWKEGET